MVGAEVGVMGGGDGDVPYVVTLSPNQNILYVLWQECKHGIGDRKAACHFMSNERDSAIDKIYSVYGAISVTKIIWKISNDETNEGHPELN
eukprot:6546869-Ditylum_brightwellii.AAC.1